jgi:hypothetical protein
MNEASADIANASIRLEILELIEEGEISVEEGARRLETLADAGGAADAPSTPVARPGLVRWVWQIVFWTGAGLVAGGGLLLAPTYTQEVAVGQVVWGLVLFVLGVMGLLLGWWLQRAHWVSVRIRQPDGPSFAFALPLPLGPIAWITRIATHLVPELKGTGVDEVILALREEAREGRHLFVEVDEGAGGEHVQVYVG